VVVLNKGEIDFVGDVNDGIDYYENMECDTDHDCPGEWICDDDGYCDDDRIDDDGECWMNPWCDDHDHDHCDIDDFPFSVALDAGVLCDLAELVDVGLEKRNDLVTVARQLAAALSKIFDANLLEAAETLAEYYNPFDGKDVSEREKAAAESALGLFNYAVKLKIVSPGIEDRARTFMADMRGNPSESTVVEALGTFLSGTDDEWVTNLKMVAVSLVSLKLASLLTIPFPVLVPVLVSLAVIENNAGYPVILGKAKQQLTAHEMAASVVPPNGDASTAADIKTKEPPPQLFSLQDLARTRADFDALRLHVEANRTYYMNQIWRAEDPNARFERFRQMGIDGYVENRLLGFVGDRAIYVLRLSALDAETRHALIAKLTAFDPAIAETVGSGSSAVTVGPVAVGEQVYSLPTPAVYMDGALGRCELLEPYLVERRDIEKRIAAAEADLAEARVTEARKLAAAPAPQPGGG
jgi:hypothetical protein